MAHDMCYTGNMFDNYSHSCTILLSTPDRLKAVAAYFTDWCGELMDDAATEEVAEWVIQRRLTNELSNQQGKGPSDRGRGTMWDDAQRALAVSGDGVDFDGSSLGKDLSPRLTAYPANPDGASPAILLCAATGLREEILRRVRTIDPSVKIPCGATILAAPVWTLAYTRQGVLDKATLAERVYQLGAERLGVETLADVQAMLERPADAPHTPERARTLSKVLQQADEAFETAEGKIDKYLARASVLQEWIGAARTPNLVR